MGRKRSNRIVLDPGRCLGLDLPLWNIEESKTACEVKLQEGPDGTTSAVLPLVLDI